MFAPSTPRRRDALNGTTTNLFTNLFHQQPQNHEIERPAHIPRRRSAYPAPLSSDKSESSATGPTAQLGKLGLNPLDSQNYPLYRSLDPNKKHIRLVGLLEGSPEDPIICTLYTVSLLENPNYEALSYVWGEPDNTAQITVNGHVHTVTANLYASLRRLRKENGTRNIWIDAISIDQSNLSERGHQVRQMRDVYKMATNVTAWLGEETEGSGCGFETFSKLSDLSEHHWNDTTIETSLGEGSLDAIHSLLKRAWWHRVWTLQESILPKSLKFLCGSHYMDSETLFGVSRSFFKHLNTCCISFHAHCPKDLMETMLTLCVLDRYRHNYRDTDLLRLVLEYRTRECSDPRDKVYGILGLVKDDEIFGQIIPDYQKSVGIVYEEIAKAFIRSSRELDVLSLALAHESSVKTNGSERMCTQGWVPDWSYGSSEDFNDAASRFERLNLYRTCGDSVCNLSRPGSSCLKLKGHVIGRITAVGEVARTDKIMTAITAYESWRKMIRIDAPGSRYYRTFNNVHLADGNNPIFSDRFIETDDTPLQSMSDAFWLVLCSSVSSLGKKPVIVQDLDAHRRLYQFWWDWATKTRANLEKLDTFLVGSEFSKMDIFRATADILVSTAMRRFAITDSILGCIGLVPRTARAGDEIVLFAGAKVPMVIRPMEHGFAEFVGDAYVHGIMHGEVWENTVEDICLI